MTVTIDFASLEETDVSCLPSGKSRSDYEMSGGRDVLVIPGNTVSMTLRVTAGESLEVLDLALDGTIETKSVHGLIAGDPIHLCFYSGLAKTAISPYIRVKKVIDDHHFTIEDSDGVAVKLKREVLLKAKTQPELCGWVAKAANLKGFHGAIVFDLDSGRRDSMLGTGAIKKDTNQLQIKGSHKLKKGDSIKLGKYSACVSMSMVVNGEDGCYTIAEMSCPAPADMRFTDNVIATLNPYEPKIEATGPGDSWGWVNVTVPGNLTRHLNEFRKPTDNNCPQFVGKFRYELRGVTVDYPAWFEATCASEPTFTRVFDYGQLWI